MLGLGNSITSGAALGEFSIDQISGLQLWLQNGEGVAAAQQQAYAGVAKIQWQDAYYRTDIAYRAVAREQQKG